MYAPVIDRRPRVGRELHEVEFDYLGNREWVLAKQPDGRSWREVYPEELLRERVMLARLWAHAEAALEEAA